MDSAKTGALIAQRRRDKNMTQKELAEKLHVSNKAVSRWETGAGFPDVSLMAPLSEALDVTVTALLSGEADAVPEEALVAESTRHFSRTQKKKLRRYRWALIAAGVLIAGIAAVLLYPKRQQILPQKDTVITYEPSTEKEDISAALTGSRSFYYNVVRADDVGQINLQLELWDGSGLRQTWDLMGLSGFMGRKYNTAPLMVVCKTGVSDFSPMDVAVYYDGGVTNASVTLPYAVNGVGWGTIAAPEHVSTGKSVILLEYSYGRAGVGGAYSPRFLGQPETIEPRSDEVALLLRMTFDAQTAP